MTAEQMCEKVCDCAESDKPCALRDPELSAPTPPPDLDDDGQGAPPAAVQMSRDLDPFGARGDGCGCDAMRSCGHPGHC